MKGSCIYIVYFGSGILKVGYTTNGVERLRRHGVFAQQMGTVILKQWVSVSHKNARSNERDLIRFCRLNGKGVVDSKVGEYFSGIGFYSALAHARSLLYDRSPVVQTKPLPVSPASAYAQEHGLQAKSLLWSVASGELRVVDALGRDVSDGFLTQSVASSASSEFARRRAAAAAP